MKRTFLLFILVFLLLACNLPLTSGGQETSAPVVVVVTSEPGAAEQVQPAATEPPALPPPAEVTATPQGYTTTLNGITMTIPNCLAVVPSVDVIAAQLPEGPGEFWPQHRAITLSGYPDDGKFFQAVIRILPLDTYPVVDTLPASRVTELKNLLATKPYTSQESLPLLPVFNAAQAFRLKIDYLDFQNGSGVRFLTEYAQYYVPMNNHDMFYTFQGLSADEKYWISAILPVSHTVLPESADATTVPPGGLPIPDWNSPTFDTDFAAYYDGMNAILNGAADDSFTPSLSCLDQFIRSLKIE